jgi:hypothetical protein
MIHSLRLVRTPSFRLPADYYASPASEVRPIFPRWVPMGCGTAAAIFLMVGFVGGAVVMHTGLGKLMSVVLDMSSGEVAPMIAKDVTPAQRDAMKAELAQLSRNLESEKTTIARLEPVLNTLKEAMDDKKITPAEVEKITKAAHDANQPVAPHKH